MITTEIRNTKGNGTKLMSSGEYYFDGNAFGFRPVSSRGSKIGIMVINDENGRAIPNGAFEILGIKTTQVYGDDATTLESTCGDILLPIGYIIDVISIDAGEILYFGSAKPD